MRYNPARQELVLKVVYYGPGLAGKTTNLQFLQRRVPAGRASELVSVDTHSERTLQFDFLAVELGKVQGLDVRLELFTVPGQSYYAATRRQVLAGADGVVFVADGRREALDENIDAMNEMLANLRHHGLPEDLPLVLQYNKQDQPTAVPPEQFQPLLNVRGWPSFPAVALTGEGVSETCEALVRMMADRLATVELPMLSPAPALGGGHDALMPAIRTPLPEPPKSWLITCHRCQSMLDVPSAVIGEVYTCGVCQSQLEVVDPDRGLTRLPSNAPRPITGQHVRPSQNIEADLYQADDIGSGGHALKPATSLHARPGYIAPVGDFPLEGFTVVGILDENPQGRRLRVREDATAKTFRALSLAPALLAQPGYRDAVEPYTRMTGPIRHPNILHLASFRQVQGADGGAMVFLSNDPQDHEPLSHVLARRRALAPPHAIGILRQIALALEEAARHGAIHGWLRPDTILISAEGSVLVDELCVPPNHRFLTRELAGVSAATEYYLAPEYLNDDLRGDIRADIFLLGALMFRMLTGEGLVTGYNALEALHKITANGPRMLRDAQQGVSRELNNFYLKLVAVDRAQRFQTYREVIDALDRFGGGARRQNLQLTVPQARGPGGTQQLRPPGTPTIQARRGGTGPIQARRGGTGALSGGTRRVVMRDSSGAQPVLPPQRRQKSSSAPLVVTVIVLLLLVMVVAFVVTSQPRGQFMPSAAPEAATAMAPRPAPGSPSSPPAPRLVDPADAAREKQEARRVFGDQLVAEQFAAALKTTERFADATERREAESQVLQRHEARKKDIEGLLKPGVDLRAVRKALEPFRAAQRMSGDLEWAVAVQSKADALVLQEQPQAAAAATDKPEPAPTPGAEASKSTAHAVGEWGPSAPAPLTPATKTPAVEAAPSPAPVAAAPAPPRPEIPSTKDASATAYAAILHALQTNQLAQAQAALVGIPAEAHAAALAQLVAWWPTRCQLVNRVATAKAARLRFALPANSEIVDVVTADTAGVSVSSSNGGGSFLSWGQMPPKTQAKLFVDAVGAPGATADDVGGAVATQLVADDQPMAVIVAKRARPVLADKAAVVDALIELHGRSAAVSVLNRGFDAARSGNAKGATDALADVRRFDKGATKGLEPEIARLEAAAADAAVPLPAPAVPAAAGPTEIAGVGEVQVPKDIRERQAALRTLGWSPIGDAWVDGVTVHLSASAGIAYEMNRNVTGFMIQATGEGYLQLIPTRTLAGNQAKIGIPLPLSTDRTASYTVSFNRDAMTVLDARGLVIQRLPLSAPPTLFMIISTADATLPTVPKPIIQ